MPFIHHFFDNKTSLTETVFDMTPAHRVKQTHSNIVIDVSSPQTEWIESDGIVTRTPNHPIGIITADCAPVLFYGDEVVGAAHAGWQGALNGVLENTVKQMACNVQSIQAFIGPCITQKSYEVSIGFEIPFLDKDTQSERFFIEGKSGKLHFDLAGYCAYRLALCGVTSIKIDGRDTVTHPDFHSHRGGATSTQRNLSAIMLKA